MSEFQYENSCQSMPTRATSSIQTSRKKSPIRPGSQQQLVSRRGILTKTRSEPKASTRSKREYLEQNSLRHAGSEYFIDATSYTTHLRRTKTQDDIPIASTHQSSDLLELFNSFQISAQDQRPPATRVLVTVSLVGCIKSVRLLVGYNSSIKDVIRASLKAYAKEGLVPRKYRSQDQAAYGLHYSPFCLQSINPMEAIHCLGTRNFFLYRSSSWQNQLVFPLEESQSLELCCSKGKPWRSFCGLVLGWITQFLQWFSKRKINFYPWMCY